MKQKNQGLKTIVLIEMETYNFKFKKTLIT